MTDCPNGEMRDRLPDLLHERLEASARAVVIAHVEACDDCRAELMLLREARVALSSDVRVVDVASIARVVIARTASPAAVETTRRRARSPWMDWRVAASIALLAVGGASFAVIRARQPVAAPVPTAVSPSEPAPVVQRVATDTERRLLPATATPAVPATAELSAAGGVGDLSDNDLRVLLDDLDSIDAMPSAEPEPVTVRVAIPGSGSIE
jgi:hypothetical protein